MQFGRLIFLGILIGVAACVWLTITQPSLQSGHVIKPSVSVRATTTPVATTPAPGTPVVAGQSSIRVVLYGVTLTVTDPVSDLVYGVVKDGDNSWAGFTTERLLAKYSNCKPGALGTLIRVAATPTPIAKPSPSINPFASPNPYPTRTPYNQPFRKTVGGYTYSYRPAYYSCATDQAGLDELASDRAAIQNAILPTLSN